MTPTTATSLLLITAAAVAAPLLSELFARWRVPSVLFELLLGILIGPAVLGWAHLDSFVDGLSTLGLGFLFFLVTVIMALPGAAILAWEGVRGGTRPRVEPG